MANLDGLGLDAQADQNAAALRMIGALVGAYRIGLVSAGLGSDLVDILTRDYAWLVWHKMQYPEYPPHAVPE